MLREADLVFHSAGKTCGRFSGDVEIFAEWFAESVLESKEGKHTEEIEHGTDDTFFIRLSTRWDGKEITNADTTHYILETMIFDDIRRFQQENGDNPSQIETAILQVSKNRL